MIDIVSIIILDLQTDIDFDLSSNVTVKSTSLLNAIFQADKGLPYQQIINKYKN